MATEGQAYTNRIREFRKAKGWTLEELATRVNVSIGQLSEIERGGRQLTQRWMLALARVLEIQPADLLPPHQNTAALTPDEASLLRAYRLAAPDQKLAIQKVAEAFVS